MADYKRIPVAEAEAIKAQEGACLLDVREPQDFLQGHLDGAQNVTDKDILKIANEVPKTSPMLVYCYHGNVSQLFARLLTQQGFEEVYSVDGGYEEWKKLNTAAPEQSAEGDLLNQRDPSGMTPLMAAAQFGAGEIVQKLLLDGAKVDLSNNDGNQALWFACTTNDPNVVGLIIAAGADLNHQNQVGATATMYAASAAKTKALSCLLDAGADVSIEMDGMTAVDMSASEEVLKMLIEAKRIQRDAGATQGA